MRDKRANPLPQGTLSERRAVLNMMKACRKQAATMMKTADWERSEPSASENCPLSARGKAAASAR